MTDGLFPPPLSSSSSSSSRPPRHHHYYHHLTYRCWFASCVFILLHPPLTLLLQLMLFAYSTHCFILSPSLAQELGFRGGGGEWERDRGEKRGGGWVEKTKWWPDRGGKTPTAERVCESTGGSKGRRERWRLGKERMEEREILGGSCKGGERNWMVASWLWERIERELGRREKRSFLHFIAFNFF